MPLLMSFICNGVESCKLHYSII